MQKKRNKKRLGDILIEEGILNDLQLAIALGEQRQWGGKLGSVLVKKGFIKEPELASILEKQLGIKWISLKGREPAPSALCTLKADVARKFKVFPLALEGDILTIALSDPTDINLIDSLHFMTGKKIRAVMALDTEILLSISRHYLNEYVSERAFDEASGIAKTAAHQDHGVRDLLPAPKQARPHRHHAANVEVMEQTLNMLIDLLDKKGVITRSELLSMMAELDN